MKKDRDKWQFGDFQTPDELARSVAILLKEKHCIQPSTIVEPSCGKGSFVRATLKTFPEAKVIAADINPTYVQRTKQSIAKYTNAEVADIMISDFFETDWKSIISEQNGHTLIVGNPPWVTSSELSLLNSKNSPTKSNFQSRRGIEAITGSSNFDISEWMLLQYVEWLSCCVGTIAILCKYSVARKVLRRVEHLPQQRRFSGHIYLIDTKNYFNASVEACLFVLCSEASTSDCVVYADLKDSQPVRTIGTRQGVLLNDIKTYERLIHLEGRDLAYVWRSGIKHDCAKVMEFKQTGRHVQNGFNATYLLERTYLYPLLKSSDVNNGRISDCRRLALVTQKKVGADTSVIEEEAPRTWQYLLEHESLLEKRRSSVYRGKPPYSIFGVGAYTFKPWKIAISGLYKALNFQLIGPIEDRPVVFDDTVNFLSFETESEAAFIYSILTSKPASDFLNSIIFWDEKRPVTIRVLKRLSLKATAKELNVLERYLHWAANTQTDDGGQLRLGLAEKRSSYTV